MNFDFSDVLRLTQQLLTVETELPKGSLPAMKGAAHTTMEAWQEGLEGSDVPASASTVQYTVAGDGSSVIVGTVSASRGTARLRGYAQAREYGSPTVAPAGDGQAALKQGQADLARGLKVAGTNAIKRALK